MRWSITEWPSQGSIAPVSGEERSAIRLGGRWSLAFLAIIVALASSGHAGAEPVYTEVTADAGIDFCHGQLYYEDSVYPCPAPATWEDQFPDHDPRLTPGAAVGDYNRDGLFDFFYTNIGTPVLLLNEGDRCVNRTAAARVDIGRLPKTGLKRWTWSAKGGYRLPSFRTLPSVRTICSPSISGVISCTR